MTRTALPNIDVFRSHARGKTEIGWLLGRHSFSFGRYYDPARMGFRSLRVINDDVVKPSRGFGMHEHDNMEILTWVLEGAVAHKDSTGNAGVIRPGERMPMTEPREGEAVTIRTTRIPESLIPWDAPRECVIDTPCKHCGRVRWEISINPWTGLCHKCESKYEVMVAEAELQASVFEVASVTWCGKYHDAGGKEAGND